MPIDPNWPELHQLRDGQVRVGLAELKVLHHRNAHLPISNDEIKTHSNIHMNRPTVIAIYFNSVINFEIFLIKYQANHTSHTDSIAHNKRSFYDQIRGG